MNALARLLPFWRRLFRYEKPVTDRPNEKAEAAGKLDALGTVRMRIGITPLQRLLIFIDGGFAFGEAQSSTTIRQTCINFGCSAVFTNATGSASKTLAGWAVGGGTEYALTNSWSVKGEYLHYDLGNISNASAISSTANAGPLTTLNVSSTTRFAGEVVRVGVNYKFGR